MLNSFQDLKELEIPKLVRNDLKKKVAILHKCLSLSLILLITACAAPRTYVSVSDVPPPPARIENVNVALVLGGGGSKGFAHAGVIEVLERNNIPIDLIVGTSIGSAIGALYADNPNAYALKDRLFKVKMWDVIDVSFLDSMLILVDLRGPVQGLFYEKFIHENLTAKNFDQLKIPFVAVTTDIENNEIYAISSGPIAPAVRASSSIPPIFSPVKIYGKTLVDGGVVAPVPVDVARVYKPKIIIAVDITAPPPDGKLKNMVDLTYRSLWNFYYELARLQVKHADVDIHPDLAGYGTFEDHTREEIYLEGIDSTEKAIPEILKKLKKLGIKLKS